MKKLRTSASQRSDIDSWGAFGLPMQYAVAMREDIDTLLDRVAEMRAVLEWYGDPKNTKAEYHEPEWAGGGSVAKQRPVDEDEGERAREILAVLSALGES